MKFLKIVIGFYSIMNNLFCISVYLFKYILIITYIKMYSITNIYNTISIHPSDYNIKDAAGLLDACVYHKPQGLVSFWLIGQYHLFLWQHLAFSSLEHRPRRGLSFSQGLSRVYVYGLCLVKSLSWMSVIFYHSLIPWSMNITN